MFGLLGKYLIPVVAAGAFAAGGFASIQIYERMIVPKRERAAETRGVERCEATMNAAMDAAAAKAKLAERMRLEAVYEDALSQQRAALAESEAELAAARAGDEKRDRDYAQKLVRAGSSCPLDDATIDFIRGRMRGREKDD